MTDKNSVHPYYIKEDVQLFFVNISEISTITSEDINLLSKAEYDERLEKTIHSFCTGCEFFEEDSEEEDYKSFRSQLCLDGSCWRFTKIDL